MFRSITALAVTILILMTSGIPTAWACSGYPYFSVENLPRMELLVRATVIDTDDRGFNAILRIENYYKGEGPRIITVMRYPVGLETGAGWRGYDTDCLYTGQGEHWQAGTTGYFGLSSNGDGTYTDYDEGTAHFYPVDGVIQYQVGATEGYRVEWNDPEAISEEAFVARMLEAGERAAPIPPDTETVQFYPLMRFLNITTENGTRYQVNPDRSVIRLPDDAPIAVSRDGAHVAFQIAPDTIEFRYIWTERETTDMFGNDISNALRSLQFRGQGVRFANDSSFVAVYDSEHLSIVMLGNGVQLAEGERGYDGMNARQIAHVEFTPLEDGRLPDVRWSADSSTLAWQDGERLWHWNLVETAVPAQIDVPPSQLLLDISSHGRFLRYGDPINWTLLDTVTGETYTNTTVSPDERFLVAARPASNDDTMVTCVPPLRDNCLVQTSRVVLPTTPETPVSVFPYRSELMGVTSCREGSGDACYYDVTSWHPAIGRTNWVGGRFIQSILTGMRLFAYDPQYAQPALVIGDYDLYFWFYSNYELDEPSFAPYIDGLQLADVIDSPIASIEWGTPIFYDEYLLSTLDHYPG